MWLVQCVSVPQYRDACVTRIWLATRRQVGDASYKLVSLKDGLLLDAIELDYSLNFCKRSC